MASESSPLHDFVTRVQDDPAEQARFRADPAGTIAAAGLSAEDTSVVQSGDPDQIQAAIQQQTGQSIVVPSSIWGELADPSAGAA